LLKGDASGAIAYTAETFVVEGDDTSKAADPVMCGAVVSGDATNYLCSTENKKTVEAAAAAAADAAALELTAVKDALKAELCKPVPTEADACPAEDPVEGEGGDGEAGAGEEAAGGDTEEVKEDETMLAKDCFAKTKDDCTDEESDLSVGHSVSVLSGVLALASALF